jgi:methionyl-tRNA formyltransferase
MRIVILTDLEDRHFYFCNRIISECHSVVGVFLGTKKTPENLYQKIKKLFRRKIVFKTIKNKLLNLAFLSSGKKFKDEKIKQEKLYFSGSKDLFEQKKSKIFCDTVDTSVYSINSRIYIDKIKYLEPDIIVVMGSCLINSEIICIAKNVINMHTGLSPYYRGGYTNFWPFLNEEYGFFGVTVHKMSTGIDSGDIVSTARPKITPDDTYGSINCKAIVLGSNLIIESINNIKNKKLFTKKQWVLGRLYHNYHFNNYFAYKYLKQRKRYIDQFCKLERKRKLDRVMLISNGVHHEV